MINNINDYIKKNILNYNKLINIKIYFFYIILITISFYLLNGFYIIKESENGIKFRFGKFIKILNPGLNWKLNNIDKINIINTEDIKNIILSKIFITSDENLILIKLNIKYKISDIKKYFLYLENLKFNLNQIFNSILTEIIIKNNIYYIFLNKIKIKNKIFKISNNIIKKYDLGIKIVDLNFKKILLPKKVLNKFNKLLLIKNKNFFHNKKIKFNYNKKILDNYNKFKYIIKQYKIYNNKKIDLINEEIKFIKKFFILYKKNPIIFKKLLYLNIINNVFKNTKNIIINNNLIKLIYTFNKN